MDHDRLRVGIGDRTNEAVADFLFRTFSGDYEVIPLRFGARHTHLDTVFGALSRGVAAVFEPAFEVKSLTRIREAYPNLVSLTDNEQMRSGANVLAINSKTIVTVSENASVNAQFGQLGLEVITVSYSEVVKSGASVRSDAALPVERDARSKRPGHK